MTINNKELYIQNLWDFGEYDDCFKSSCRLSDVDAWINIGNCILVLEFKSPGVPVRWAQTQTFRVFTQHPNQVAMVVWGKPNEPEAYYKIKNGKCPSALTQDDGTPCDNEGLKEQFRRWNRMAKRTCFVEPNQS